MNTNVITLVLNPAHMNDIQRFMDLRKKIRSERCPSGKPHDETKEYEEMRRNLALKLGCTAINVLYEEFDKG